MSTSPPRTADTSPQPESRTSASELRTGGVCALLGTLVYAVAGMLHGALTAGSDGSNVIFEHVVDRPLWGVVNFGMLLAGLAWLVAFVVIARSLSTTPAGNASGSAFLGQLATVFLTFGLAAATLLYLVDAVVLPNLAAEWSAAPTGRDELVHLGDTAQSLIRVPLFDVMPLFIFGLPFAFMGCALIPRRSTFPAWLGWLAGAVGTASFGTASLWVLGIDIVPEIVLWAVFQPLIWVWFIAVGIVVLRRSRAEPPSITSFPSSPHHE